MPLLEREAPLAALRAHLDDAAAGHGRLVVVAGEAGAGKSTFVEAALRAADGSARTAVGYCDGSSTPAPLAPLAEMLPSLPADVWPEGAPRQEVFARLRTALAADGPPFLLVVEDAHWADEATLDLLRHLARRAHLLRAVVVVTYRSEEVGRGHPLQAVLGDLATAAGLRRIDLAPLTPAAVAQLVAESGARDVDAVELHRLTGGNAFFVTEALAAGEGLPTSVRDAVLARTARLTEPARAALDVVALVGPRAEPELLAALLPAGLAVLDEPLERQVLQLVGDDVAFRHDLARLAVAEQVPAFRRVALHERILDVLETRSRESGAAVDEARMAHHAEAAGRTDSVLRHAPRAAAEAAALGAHREAAEQYRRALRHAADLPPQDRAALLAALSYECYLTDEITASLEARRAALEIWDEAGDRERVGDSHRWLSRLSWFAGLQEPCREHARLAVETLAGTDSVPLAMAHSNLAQIAMLAGDLAGTRRWGASTLAVLDRLPATPGADEVRIHVHNNMGSAEITNGDAERGRALLRDSLSRALAGGLDEHAARAYCNLAWAAVTQHRGAEAHDLLDEGLEFCRERDLDSWALYLQGLLSQLLLDEGDPRAALREADDVLRHTGVSAINRIQPLTVAARARAGLGRADWQTPLTEAAELAARTGELQRIGPAAVAAAEIAWLTGDPEAARAAVAQAWDMVDAADNPWQRGAIAVWLDAALQGRPGDPGPPLPAPHAEAVEGRWRESAEEWSALGRPHEQALALARSGDRDDLARAAELFDDLGLPAGAARARSLARARGWVLPRGAQRSTREHPAGLTAREAEVAALLADGLTNAAIADALVISPRTVEHHVASILTKLGVTSRHEVRAPATDAPR
ncbi:AAA family ATPase [Actinotalea sp. M2MS4P-6]|uniref:helix-turn-helix transcriptional regulator n=1 Tax=Actinotalea sp. M2MS4P-6 TaxID=2983762 RepID=UPI0021E448CE|nr:LuxR family transcriptional regulator [Actinotalea sp. M2MS4P-6]MCV2395241.1 AAA family ATPase [Actinotalea sp. M2MS4P-6]